jgi:hypothetical protein
MGSRLLKVAICISLAILFACASQAALAEEKTNHWQVRVIPGAHHSDRAIAPSPLPFPATSPPPLAPFSLQLFLSCGDRVQALSALIISSARRLLLAAINPASAARFAHTMKAVFIP